MKKLILLTLLAFVFFSVSSSLALTIKTKSSPPKAKPETTSTPTTSTTTQPAKQPNSKVKGETEDETTGYAKCLNLEMQRLTKEMQERKKTAREEYKNALKSATSTQGKTKPFSIKIYNNALIDIDKWFNQATKEAKEKCKSISAPTSTATSTQ
jgi:hypothetical protein